MNTKKILLFLFLTLCSFRWGGNTAFALTLPFTQNGIVYNKAHNPNSVSYFKDLLEVVGFVPNELVDKTNVTIPNTVKIDGVDYKVYGVCLGHNEYDGCSTIESIKLPESVTYFRLYDPAGTHSFTNQSNQKNNIQ